MYLLACDIGYGYTKYMEVVISGEQAEVIEENKKFPSAIRHLFVTGGFNVEKQTDYVEYEDKGYYVGYSALASDKGLRIRTAEFMLENLPIFLTRIFKEKKVNKKPDILIIGTPFQEWQRLKDKFVERAIDFGNKVYCVPQAAAASLIIPPKEDFLIIDIGYNTCDIVPINEKGQIIADEGISWEKLGVSSLLEDVDNFIKNTLGIALSPSNLEMLLEKPKRIKKIFFNVPGDLIEPIESKIRTIIQNKFYYLNAKIIDKFGSNYLKIALVGGGANIYKKEFKKYYGRKIAIPKNPVFSNTKGFVLLGLSYMNFKGKIVWKNENKGEKDKQNPEIDNIETEENTEKEEETA